MDENTVLHSVGHIATLAETSVPEVRRILAEIGAKPALVLNLCEYYAAPVAGTVLARTKGWTEQEAFHRTYGPEAEING